MSGVTDYVKASVDIYFEEGHVACAYCPLLETYSRNMCRKSGEFIVDTRYTVGRWCPLKFDEEVISGTEIQAAPGR